MDRPIRATKHCRHYSYERGKTFHDGGPRCAVGCDVSESVNACMPNPTEVCDKREDYTDSERTQWRAYTDHRTNMLCEAVGAFGPVECGTEARRPCPHCGGTLVLQRMSNGHAWLDCTTPECIGPVHFNVDRKAIWPAQNDKT